MDFLLLVVIVILALAFDYINGFHDAANAIATVVSTRALSPKAAVIYGAVLNVAGAFAGTAVAATISKGLVEPALVTPATLICALLSAIIWNLITWYKAMPTSSSHALIGSLCGAAFMSAMHLGWNVSLQSVQWSNVLQKVIKPMLVSPLIGFVGGYILMLTLYWVFSKVALSIINRFFSKMQLLSAGFLAFSHGSNDAQKSMGVIALAISMVTHTAPVVPIWVKLACATAMGLGTISGGWKIIRTVGSKMIKIHPINGFAAETTAGSVILISSLLAHPLSTTQVITASIMGVGATKRLSAVRWGVVGDIVWAWILTLPFTFLLSAGLYWGYALVTR